MKNPPFDPLVWGSLRLAPKTGVLHKRLSIVLRQVNRLGKLQQVSLDSAWLTTRKQHVSWL